MNKKIVVIERIYEATIEKVWEALTNKDQMKQWYFDVSDFKAEVGFEFQFSAENEGKIYLHKCQVVEAKPITKIAYTWSYEGYEGQSLVTFELFSEDENKTRLKLTHSGTDSFLSHPDFEKADFNEGWESILGQSLRNFVETGSFNKSIRIRASLKNIWDIVLNPNNQWGTAFGGGAIAETDWNEGSLIIWRDAENNIGATGVVEVHRPEEYLQLHYYDDVEQKPETALGDYYEKYRIVPDKDGYILSIEVGKMAKSDIPFHQKMWDDAINIIKELSEKE
ncbi:MAG: SRPBCC domain-containing protein [Pseudosphingobacterium sp.]|nr:SRPBCC domain-containing protein [Olivibacter sp. UJ_SKK_5.1]MDX3915155.1 SRPBCC domain-containing protein [Pseudosphingobacterium sp.]